MGGVARYFHKGIVAAGVNHLGQQFVQSQRVGSGVRGRNGTSVHVVAHRGEQPGLVAFEPGHLVEQGSRGGLAVGAGDAHKFQFVAGMPVPCRSEPAQGVGGIGHADIGDAVGYLRGEFLANYGGHTCRGHHGYIFMTVGCHTAHGHEHSVFLDTPGIALQAEDVPVGVAYYFKRLDVL